LDQHIGLQFVNIADPKLKMGCLKAKLLLSLFYYSIINDHLIWEEVNSLYVPSSTKPLIPKIILSSKFSNLLSYDVQNNDV